MRGNGFSFIELLVVVMLIGVLAATGSPNMAAFSREVKAEQEVKIVFNDLCLLRDATLAAGTGTGTATFYRYGDIPGLPFSAYVLRDPSGNYIRRTFNDGSFTRDLSNRNLGFSIANSPGTEIATTIDFTQTLPSTATLNIQINYCDFFDSPPEIATGFASTPAFAHFVIGVTTQTRQLFLKDLTGK